MLSELVKDTLALHLQVAAAGRRRWLEEEQDDEGTAAGDDRYIPDDLDYTPTVLGGNKILAISPKIPSALSLIGSYVLIREIVTELRSQRPRNSKPLLRALLAMSVADIFFTIPWFMTTWMAPRDLDYLWGNVGTRETCTLQGWMFQFGVQSGPLFNVTFSIFSLLLVRYQWNERQLVRLEPYIHGSIWAYAVAASVFPIPLGLYNNVFQICWLEGYPYGCADDDGEIDCERGDNGWIYAIAFTFFPPWLCMVISLVIMFLIWSSVRDLENRLSRYAGSMVATSSKKRSTTTTTTTSTSTTSASLKASTINEDNPTTAADASTSLQESVLLQETAARFQANRDKSKAVARQAIWYMLAFLLTFSLDAILSVFYYADLASEKALEPLDFFAYLLYPLQGFFNFIIFARPRTEMVTREGRWLRKITFWCCCCCHGERRKGGGGSEKEHSRASSNGNRRTTATRNTLADSSARSHPQRDEDSTNNNNINFQHNVDALPKEAQNEQQPQLSSDTDQKRGPLPPKKWPSFADDDNDDSNGDEEKVDEQAPIFDDNQQVVLGNNHGEDCLGQEPIPQTLLEDYNDEVSL